MSLTARTNTSVRLYRKTITAETYPPTISWDEMDSSPVMCVRNRLSADERIARDGKVVDITEVLYMRPIDLTESDRVRIGDTMFDIFSVKDPNRRGKHMKVELMQILDTPPPEPEPEEDPEGEPEGEPEGGPGV